MHRVLALSLGLAATAATTVAVVSTTAGPATAAGRTTLQTALTGAQEVPGPGDPDGRGNGVVKVDGATGEICVVLTTHGTDELLAGHIHRKAAGSQTGPVVVPLTQTGPSKFQGCATNGTVASGLITEPQAYYLNVHNGEFPNGALRGDLG